MIRRGLLNAQDNSDPLAVGGQVEGSAGGIVLMELLPSQEARSEMEVGDSYQQVLVAAAQVDEEGNYGVRLDPKAAVLGNTDNYLLTYLDQSGEVEGFGAGAFERSNDIATRAGAGVAFDQPATLNLSTGSQGPSEDHGETEDSYSPPQETEPEDYGCIFTIIRTGIMVPATVVVAGTNTRSVDVTAGFSNNASSSLGFAASVAGGPWVGGSGGTSVTNSSGISKTWPTSHEYGTFSFRAQVEYHEEQATCLVSSQEYKRRFAVGYTGGFFPPEKWASTSYPKWCTPQSKGEVKVTSSTATTWSAGAKLSTAVGSLDVSSQSGYSTETWVRFYFNENNRYLCGKRDWPARTPGYLMADFKER